MHSFGMEDQAKASPPSPLDGGTGLFERALRWLGVVAFAAFALSSGWEWVTYTPDPQTAAPFLSPPDYPNTLLVKFTLGEYLETFGPWQGFGGIPWMVWLQWLGLILFFGGMVWFLALILRFNAKWANFASGEGLMLGALLLCVPLGLFGVLPAPYLLGDQSDMLSRLFFPCWAAVYLLGAILLLFRRRVRRGGRNRGWFLRWKREKSIPQRLVLGLLSLLLLIAFLSASTPEINSDPLRYHLGAPQVWLDGGDLSAPIEGMAFSHFPFLIEKWLMMGLALDGDALARLLHLLFALISLWLIFTFTRSAGKWGGLKGRQRRWLPLLAVILAATVPSFTITSTWANIDAGVVCFLLAATMAHAIWWRTGRARYLVLAAVLTGFMLGTKYTALVPAFVLGLGVLAHRTPTLEDLPYTAIERLTNGLIALAIGSPWWIRNWVQTGNPVYPLANETFQADGWDAECQALWEEKAAQKGVGYDWHLMGAAWRGATFAWAGGEGVGEGGFEDQSIGLTPWLLAPLGLAGLLLLALRRGGWWWFYLVFIAVNFVLWFRTYQSNRLLLSTLLVALPGAVVGLAELTRRWRAMWVAAVIALSVASVYQGLWIARYFMLETYPLQLTLGFMDPDEWRSARLNYFDGAKMIEALVPEDESALVIGESRRFHFPPNVVMSDWYDPPAVRRYLEAAGSADALTDALASDGITHVFINHAELFPLWALNQEMLRSDGVVNAAAYWGAWQNRDPMIFERSNFAYFRRRFDDAQAAVLAQWLSTVPHEVIWRGDRPQTVGVELWGIGVE
jgi:dolichyl-phosphate-mannose-protein mannosyltransferase